MLAVKWCQLLDAANNSNILNDGQFGGHPGCEAQFLTFLEELKYDICYLTWQSMFSFNKNAMSCYDSINFALASLANRKYGQHRKVVLIHAKTLEQARYHLQMALSLSETEYSNCIPCLLYGTEQGSGNSPYIWLFISSTLFNVHSAQAHRATFFSPDGSIQVCITMVGFVNNTMGSSNDFRPQDQLLIDEISNYMAHHAQLWQDLLHALGGGLEPQKLSYCSLYFTFLTNGTPKVVLNP